MHFTCEHVGREAQIATLFETVFTASEGVAEGAAIGRLARDLLFGTDPADIDVCLAADGDDLIGCIIFTRLTFADDDRTVFLMAPVAVATARQGQGVGRGLIAQGLDALRRRGVDVAVTYGDPAYYGRAGFAPVSISKVAPPWPLSQPHGWLARTLDGSALNGIKGPSACVAAFDDPAYW